MMTLLLHFGITPVVALTTAASATAAAVTAISSNAASECCDYDWYSSKHDAATVEAVGLIITATAASASNEDTISSDDDVLGGIDLYQP